MKQKISVTSIVILLFVSFVSQAAEPIVPDAKTDSQLVDYLDGICKWIVAADVGSGKLKIQALRKTSIFVNSNLARVLVAGYEITNNDSYLQEALQWYDHLVDLQQVIPASNGAEAGFWGDFSPAGNIYLGDAGTSATALAGAIRFATGARREKYLKALERYANFVRYGSKEDPQNKGRESANSFIIQSGKDTGGVGAGYYRNKLSTAPYTIATSVTGASFFSCYYELTGKNEYMKIAENAARWMIAKRSPFGEIPYILHDSQLDEWPLDTMSYVTDGIVGVYLRTHDENLKKEIVRSFNHSIQWLLNHQNKYGTWGKLRSEDQQRSQGVLSLLVWYYDQVAPFPRILQSIRANYTYFLNPENSKAFGVKELPITTGFVGLGIAEVIEPGITYRIKK